MKPPRLAALEHLFLPACGRFLELFRSSFRSSWAVYSCCFGRPYSDVLPVHKHVLRPLLGDKFASHLVAAMWFRWKSTGVLLHSKIVI